MRELADRPFAGAQNRFSLYGYLYLTEKIGKMSDSLTLNGTRSIAVRLWLPNYGESSRPTVVAGICLRCVGLELFSTPEISSDGDDYRAVNNNK